MAAVALNSFKTIRKAITTGTVGIYTCPVGVSAIVLLAQVTNLTSSTTSQVTALHSRPGETPTDYKFANGAYVPPNDSINLVPDGRLSLETNDIIKINGSGEGELNIILSVLETAKQ
jgi:hypothetical protein